MWILFLPIDLLAAFVTMVLPPAPEPTFVPSSEMAELQHGCPSHRLSCTNDPDVLAVGQPIVTSTATETSSLRCWCSPTPLVIAFDDRPVEFAPDQRFAYSPGHPVATDWPTTSTPWLAMDRDGNGVIESGAELFGDSTVLADGTTARHGFAALAALDANRDAVIDHADPAFQALRLWADRDRDGRGTPDELVTLASVVVSISLDYRVDERCDARGNCERERASITWRGHAGLRRGSVIDIYPVTE